MNVHNSLAPIPWIDLQAQRARLEPGMSQAILRVLEHGRFVLGPEVEELERQLAQWAGAHCVSCANGTDALELSLWALEVGIGDAVVMPAFTFAATAEAAVRRGATPVFADVTADSFHLDPESVAACFDKARRSGLRPRALIAVDLYGQPADYAALGAVAAAYGATVIADAAQSFGGSQGNRPVGSLAPFSATSFYPSKPLGCYGDGGAVFATDPEMAQKLRLLARHGQGPGRYNHLTLGMNSRLDSMQAAVLLQKLAVLAEELPARDACAKRYDEAFKRKLPVPPRTAGDRSAWACYTIRHPERDRLAATLQASGIASSVHYPKPLNRQPAYTSRPVAPGGVPHSERLSAEVLSLPLCAYLSEAAQERVIRGVLAAI